MDIASYIDHTLLKPTATEPEIVRLCREALQYSFYSVCVNSCYVDLCRNVLQEKPGNPMKIASVVGFPLGAMDMFSKINEAENAIKNGAHEIDMVMNIGFLKLGRYDAVESEIRKVKEAIGHNILKVIIETCYLSNDEKKIATQIVCDAGGDFVKTSTGFGTAGATIDDILLMKEITGNTVRIKASGGIKDLSSAKKFIEAGAGRIGTSSGIDIVKGGEQINKQDEHTY